MCLQIIPWNTKISEYKSFNLIFNRSSIIRNEWAVFAPGLDFWNLTTFFSTAPSSVFMSVFISFLLFEFVDWISRARALIRSFRATDDILHFFDAVKVHILDSNPELAMFELITSAMLFNSRIKEIYCIPFDQASSIFSLFSSLSVPHIESVQLSQCIW